MKYPKPVQFSRGINLRDLMTSDTEFHIDLDFNRKKKIENLLEDNETSEESDDDENNSDVYRNIDETTEKMMLSSPEYLSFDEISSKMIDCVPSGSVKMLIIEEGDGPLVPVDAEVTIHYAAYWEKATIPFDSTLTMNFGTPLRVRLGQNKILPGLEVGLTMVHGPTARFHLLLHPDMTWGSRGVMPRVRPEVALFVIVLYDVRDVQAAARFNDLPKEEQAKFEVTMKTVKSLHYEAKVLFQKKKYKKAIKNYQQSMSVLNISQPKNESEEMEVKNLRIKAYVNLAVCYYKINKPKYVIRMCENLDQIVDINNHCKALFYYGRAEEMLGRSDEALKYYKKALKIEPKNKEIGKTLAHLDDYMKKSVKKEKEMWQSVFKLDTLEKQEDIAYTVDEDFQDGVKEMCQDLAERNEYAKIDLPTGLRKPEVECIKSLVSKYEGLILSESGEGKRKKVAIIRKVI